MKNEIRKIINEWDPIGLFPHAPEDEYYVEVDKILSIFESNPQISVDDLAKEIGNIFIKAFNMDVYSSNVQKVKNVAMKILQKDYYIGFLYCSNPLNNRKVDFDYEDEYSESLEYAESYLFSYEDLVYEGKLKLNKVNLPCKLIYRGWMLKPEEYKSLYEKLVSRGTYLINTPDQYEYCHMFPNWYEKFKDNTARSKWTRDYSKGSLINLLKNFKDNPIVVKDYVKSRKHEWNEAFYIPKASDYENAIKVINTFIERQGEDLVGGVVLREFIKLKSIGVHEKSNIPLGEEYRGFYLNGKLVCVIEYWSGNIVEDRFSNEEMDFIKEVAEEVNSDFYTVDFARCENEKLIIMEMGDGQVSGLQDAKVKEFYKKLGINSQENSIERKIPRTIRVL